MWKSHRKLIVNCFMLIFYLFPSSFSSFSFFFFYSSDVYTVWIHKDIACTQPSWYCIVRNGRSKVKTFQLNSTLEFTKQTKQTPRHTHCSDRLRSTSLFFSFPLHNRCSTNRLRQRAQKVLHFVILTDYAESSNPLFRIHFAIQYMFPLLSVWCTHTYARDTEKKTIYKS